MKQFSIITAILLLAFNLSAQSNRTRTERETRSTSSSENVDRNKSNTNQQAVRPSSTSRSSGSAAVRTENRTTRSSGSSSRDESVSRTGSSERSSIERSSRSTREVHRDNDQPRPSVYDRGHSEQTRTREVENNRSAVRTPDRSSGREVERTTTRTANRSRTVVTEREYKPRTGHVYTEKRRTYTYYHPNRAVRRTPSTVYYSYRPIEYRRVHYVYRTPPTARLVWDIHMYNEYRYLYPHYDLWYYPIGYRIHTISAYDATMYIGEVARVYGEVFDTWYSRNTDEYYLYIGAPFPYQDFTVVLEGHDARRFSSRPHRFFTGRHVAATGLIGVYEGKPEMFLKKRSQIDVY